MCLSLYSRFCINQIFSVLDLFLSLQWWKHLKAVGHFDIWVFTPLTTWCKCKDVSDSSDHQNSNIYCGCSGVSYRKILLIVVSFSRRLRARMLKIDLRSWESKVWVGLKFNFVNYGKTYTGETQFEYFGRS